MIRKIKSYSDEFKTKIILEVLREEKSITQIAGKYEVPPTTIQSWKE